MSDSLAYSVAVPFEKKKYSQFHAFKKNNLNQSIIFECTFNHVMLI